MTPGLKSLHQHVALCGHLARHLQRRRLFEIEDQGPLAAIERDGVSAVLAVSPPEAAPPIAFRRLDLDDLGAVLSQAAWCCADRQRLA